MKRVSTLLAEKVREYIHFPLDPNAQRMNIAKFYEIAAFPRVCGCVDGTQIKILNPGGNNGEVYRNRKGYFSLNVQVLQVRFCKLNCILYTCICRL